MIGKEEEKARSEEARMLQRLRFFLTDGGCKKGLNCTYKLEFDGDKQGRCRNCGGTSHTRKDCPVKAWKSCDGDGGAKNYSGNDVKGQIVKKVEVEASAPTTGGGEGSPTSRAGNGPQPDGGSGEAVRGLIQEAAGLLKSLSCASGNVKQILECHARGKHLMEEEWRLGEEQGADYELVRRMVEMLSDEDVRLGAWLRAMQKAEDLEAEETCARRQQRRRSSWM